MEGSVPSSILIVTFLGAAVNKYMALYLQFLETITLVCPYCQGACHRHAWYKRKVNDGYVVFEIRILRLVCLSCRRTHAVLPDFLQPFGRYIQQARETIVPCIIGGVPVEKTVKHGQAVETSRRWLFRTKRVLNTVASALAGVLASLGESPPLLRGSPFCQVNALCRRLADVVGVVPEHSCFFGLCNTFLSLGGSGVWL